MGLVYEADGSYAFAGIDSPNGWSDVNRLPRIVWVIESNTTLREVWHGESCLCARGVLDLDAELSCLRVGFRVLVEH